MSQDPIATPETHNHTNPPGFTTPRNQIMDFAKLAAGIQQLEPTAAAHEVAQIATLVLRQVDQPESLQDETLLKELFEDTKLRLKAASDQHAAMSEEIRNLACSDPRKYSPDEVWVLVRAIKVQSQMLEMYVGESICSTN